MVEICWPIRQGDALGISIDIAQRLSRGRLGILRVKLTLLPFSTEALASFQRDSLLALSTADKRSDIRLSTESKRSAAFLSTSPSLARYFQLLHQSAIRLVFFKDYYIFFLCRYLSDSDRFLIETYRILIRKSLGIIIGL